MENILVSIITPTYNQGDFVVRAVESVLNQTYKNIEYIVLDDGSSDNTDQILDSYKDSIIYFKHNNIGQALTLNRGWSMSKGQILGYLSADDVLKPNAIQELLNAFTLNPDVDLVYCDYDLIDAKDEVISTVIAADYSYERMLCELLCFPGPGALFRRSIFDKYGGWSPSLRQIPDFEYWLRIANNNNFLRVPQVLAQYRIHHGSSSFSIINESRSNEILTVVENFWCGKDGNLKAESISRSALLASKNHLQSGRMGVGLKLWISSIRLNPRALINPSYWRVGISGLLRRLYYRSFNMGKIE